MPKVLGDSNQLLQVCLQLVANCLHVLSERGGRVLTVSTERQDGHFGASDRHRTAASSTPSADGSRFIPSIPKTVSALSACQGILQEHRGQISRERREDGAMLLRVELPITESAPVRTRNLRCR